MTYLDLMMARRGARGINGSISDGKSIWLVYFYTTSLGLECESYLKKMIINLITHWLLDSVKLKRESKGIDEIL